MEQALFNLNILTESEILILDTRNTEVSDEEDGFEKYDHAEDGDAEDCIDEDVVEEINENVYDYCSSEDDPQATPSFENLESTSYSGLRLIQSISRTNAHQYFSINIPKKTDVFAQATARSYLQDRQTHLSCDRLQRVQLKKD